MYVRIFNDYRTYTNIHNMNEINEIIKSFNFAVNSIDEEQLD